MSQEFANKLESQHETDYERVSQLFDHLLEKLGEQDSKQLLDTIKSLSQTISAYNEQPV